MVTGVKVPLAERSIPATWNGGRIGAWNAVLHAAFCCGAVHTLTELVPPPPESNPWVPGSLYDASGPPLFQLPAAPPGAAPYDWFGPSSHPVVRNAERRATLVRTDLRMSAPDPGESRRAALKRFEAPAPSGRSSRRRPTRKLFHPQTGRTLPSRTLANTRRSDLRLCWINGQHTPGQKLNPPWHDARFVEHHRRRQPGQTGRRARGDRRAARPRARRA